MSEPPTPSKPHEPSVTQNVSGGVTVQPGGDTQISGDVVGRDKVTQNTTTVTNVGMAPEAVRRLVLTVGMLVFVTALCFFSGGIAVGAVALQALNRPVDSSQPKAVSFKAKMDDVSTKEAGEAVAWSFSESELSSYFRLQLGSRIGLAEDTGRARVLPSEEVEFYGRWSGFFNLPVLVVTTIEKNSPVLYHTQRAAVRLFGNEDSALGLIALPNFVVQPLVDAINADIGHQVIAKEVQYPPTVSVPNGTPRPVPDSELMIGGAAK